MSHQTECICVHLRRLAHGVTEAYDEALAASGVKVTQFSLLRAVERTEPVAIGRLADELGLDRTTLARNLRPLERDGLLTTAAADADRRVTEVRLTAPGRRAIARALPAWRSVQAALAARIGERRLGVLRELALVLAPHGADDPPRAPGRRKRR